MLVHDLSNLDLEPVEMLNGSIDVDAPFDVESNRLAVANTTSLMVFNLMNMEDEGYQMIMNKPMPQPQELYLSSSTTTGYIVQLSDGNLSAIDLNGLEIGLGLNERPIARVAVNDLELAIVYQDAPTTVHFARIGGMGSIAIKEINASASVEQDAILMEWGTPVDMENASILNLVFDEAFLATTVNVSATDRLVVYNRSSDAQWLASDPKYRVSDPSMYNGILAWSTRDHFDPTKPQAKYMDGEIQFLNLTENQTLLLTSDELNQFGPQVLTDHLVYFQEEESGDLSVHIHSWTPELNVYSNILLQVGLLAAFLLAFIYAYQRQSERSTTLKQAEEE